MPPEMILTKRPPKPPPRPARPFVETGLVVHNTCYGIGDIMTGLMACAGLQRDHPGEPVTYVLRPWLESWAELFYGYDHLRIGPDSRSKRALNYDSDDRNGESRWALFARQSGTTPVMPLARPLLPRAVEWAEQYRGCVVLAPWATDSKRTWPPGRWRDLEAILYASGRRCVIIDNDNATGTVREPGRSAEFESDKLIRYPPSMLAPLFRVAAVLIGNDSGMAHVAGMLDVPTLAICAFTPGQQIFGCYRSVRVVQGERFEAITPSQIAHHVYDLKARQEEPTMETAKEHERRTASGWFGKYVTEPGLDIGAGMDPLNSSFRQWDKPDGDCTFLAGVSDASQATVYASHVLEHLDDPLMALRNWWRVLRPGGHLIVCVPHRDLYEKKTTLPSRWNPEHKTYWLPAETDPPCTCSLRGVLAKAIPDGEVVSFAVLDANYSANGDRHPRGAYSIEAVLHKAAR